MKGKKSLAAACAAAALLSGLAFSGTAMAAGQATLTLNAAQGSSLAGHTFEVYRIGGYYDVVTSGGKVSSFGVRGDTTSNAWAKDAIGDYNQSADDDIEIPLGYDEAGAIGRRYRREDEIGTPLCVTVDFDTIDDHAVTVRERDTMAQERVSLDKVAEYVAERVGEKRVRYPQGPVSIVGTKAADGGQDVAKEQGVDESEPVKVAEAGGQY